MRSSSRAVLMQTFLMAVAGLALAGGAAQAAKFKVLHSFCEPHHRFCGDGANPQAALAMDSAGNFFGTTTTAGLGFGTVFELERKPSGGFKFKTLYRFCSQGFCGGGASGALVIDAVGNLYGTAGDLVFELSRGGKKGLWTEKVLHQFCSSCTDGSGPLGGLTYAGASSGVPYDGVSPLYGVTQLGGANKGGTVFRLTNNSGNWNESVLYNFCSQGGSNCTDGKSPSGGLIVDQAGNFFGVASEGGNHFEGVGAGAVFQLTPKGASWIETTLYRFCSQEECTDGALPIGRLTSAADGSLYGVSSAGGGSCPPDSGGCGVIFKVVPNGEGSAETVLHAFCTKPDCKDGHAPRAGLLLDASGNLYGTTWFGGGNDIDVHGLGGGVAFKLSGSTFTVIHSFCSLSDCADGEYPLAPLVMDESGKLFGTSSLGGAFVNDTFGGTLFRLTP